MNSGLLIIDAALGVISSAVVLACLIVSGRNPTTKSIGPIKQ
jgi:hypothetical protein